MKIFRKSAGGVGGEFGVCKASGSGGVARATSSELAKGLRTAER